MKIKPVLLAVLTLVVIFGGIGIAQLAGWWHTSGGAGKQGQGKNNRIVIAGGYTPDDIRGSFSLATVAQAFSIQPDVLLAAFGLPPSLDPAALRTSSLSSLFQASGVDISNGSVRIFVAYYLDLPLATGDDSYLPESASKLIRQAQPDLSAERQAFLDSHTVDCAPDLTGFSLSNHE
jgi:hypothetical protein